MKESSKPKSSERLTYVKERSAFRTLLLSNPNYFGNLPDSKFKAILPIQGNIHYEELKCIGYQPQQKFLEGVVHVYQPSGYGTGICGQGTTEFVRFYLSYNNGASWVDAGLSSFRVYNIPEGTEGRRHLEYAVTLPVDPRSMFCFTNPLIHVRAILSWNFPPPPNMPNWMPVWGNVREAAIQVEPWRIFPLGEFLKQAELPLPVPFENILDLEAPVQSKIKELDTLELANLYAKEKVPVHRYAFKELLNLATSAEADLNAELLSTILPPDVQIDPNMLELLFPNTDGDIGFEELTCVGLDPNVPDTLVGILKIKRRYGYSGGVCTRGSTEFVTFWGDFDGNGSFDTCLGTANVQVYDIPQVPADGIYYAVRLPVDLSAYRKACQRGAAVVRIRAILSWNHPAPCFNPNYVPTWGNREETLIFITPKRFTAGKIAILGGIPVQHISNVTGLTTAGAVFALNNLPPDPTYHRPCPFGGWITAQGEPLAGHSYLMEVSPDGAVWTPVLNDITVTDSLGNTSTHSANPVTHRFSYLPHAQNVNGLLARWPSNGDRLWLIRLSVYDAAGILQGTDTHVIQLDNTWPTVSIDITSGGGNCSKFKVGDVLSGNYVARDQYMGNYSIAVEPAVNPPGVGIPTPSSGISNTPLAGAPWQLNTAGMMPCGYVIRVDVRDRAILNSQSVGHYAHDSAGFCLENG